MGCSPHGGLDESSLNIVGTDFFPSKIAWFWGQICMVFLPLFAGFGRYFEQRTGKKIANFLGKNTHE